MFLRLFISSLFIFACVLQSEAEPQPHHSHTHSVLDSDGNELRVGQAYYLVSAYRGGHGGGVSFDRGETSRMAMVKQLGTDKNFGTPVIFIPASNPQDNKVELERVLLGEKSKERIIRESMDLNIKFSEMPVVWQVEEERESSASHSQMRHVILGGKLGHPGSSTLRNWFKIERMSRSSPAYRIAYCPNVCESCRVMCGNVGVTMESGKRWLSVSQHREFPFVFVKASRS